MRMKTAIINIKNKEDENFLKALFRKMKIKARILSVEEMEDIVLGKMIDEGMKGETVSEKSVMRLLKKNAG